MSTKIISHRFLPLFLVTLGLAQIFCLSGSSIWPGVGAASAQSYGVPIDSYPAWQERAMMTAMNACRLDPVGFRDAYLQYQNILLPENHPPTHPLAWNEDLNHSARFHSEDMASCNTFSHNSCDGTGFFDRVISFYYPYWALGENIVAGNIVTPFSAVVVLLEDGGALDGTMEAGHRTNIMSPNFLEAGNGYCYDFTTDYDNWYTTDFGAQDGFVAPPSLVDGTHLFLASGTTSFWANYYSSEGTAVASAKVYVEGVSYDLSQDLTGTWSVDLPSGDGCRSYTFQFVDGEGETLWYPVVGSLRTWGEGGCTEDYLDDISRVPTNVARLFELEPAAPNPFNPSTKISFRLDEPTDVRLTIVDISGRLLRTLLVAPREAGTHGVMWDGRNEAGRRVASGTYFARLSVGTGDTQVQKLTMVK